MSLADDFPSIVCNFTLRPGAFASDSVLHCRAIYGQVLAKAQRPQRKNAQQNYRSYKPSKEV
jgi:hypothetical protein